MTTTESRDRLLHVLFVLALFSVGGGILVILHTVGGDLSIITGFATTTQGTVNVSVTKTAAITLNNSLVNFGAGQLAGGEAGTRVNSTIGNTNPSSFLEPSPFSLRNDGNVNVNVTINGTPAATFLNSRSTYEWAGLAGEGGCKSNNLTTARSTMSATHTIICANLTFIDTTDTFAINIFLNLSSDLPVGNYTDAAVEFIATECVTVGPGDC